MILVIQFTMCSTCFDALQVLTKDSVTVSVDAVVYYRVSDATVSVANVENAHHSTRLLAQTTLRNVLGTKNLSEILSERESIANSMQVGCSRTVSSSSSLQSIPVFNRRLKRISLTSQVKAQPFSRLLTVLCPCSFYLRYVKVVVFSVVVIVVIIFDPRYQ